MPKPVTKRDLEILVNRAEDPPHDMVVKRSRELQTVFHGVTKFATIIFKSVPKTTDSPRIDFWQQDIQMPDWSVSGGLEEGSIHKLRTELLHGLKNDAELRVGCQCPAFLYWGYEYINTQFGSIIGTRQKIYPKVRNPDLEGVVCKHLYRALNLLPFVVGKIATQLVRGKYIRDFKPATRQLRKP